MASSTELPPRTEPRRRNRRPKACLLCRARKVRCDYQEPCSTCVRRQHPQLCNYHSIDRTPVTDKERLRPEDAAETLSNPDMSRSPRASRHSSPVLQTQRLSGISASPSDTPTENLSQLCVILDHMATNVTASCETDEVTGQVTFVGRRAHANLFRTLLPYLPDHTLSPSASVETVFGLTNRTISQPFISLWNTTARIAVGDILRSLPPAETCLRYYRSYQQTCHPFFPVIDDMEAFERYLCVVLERLVAEGDEASSYKTQLAAHLPRAELLGYALLFAVLASGSQCCLISEGDHDLALSFRVFAACSFECLNLANHYVSPSTESIQTILILARVNCNDGSPGVAMSILGMAAQQAQGLGLHARHSCSCSSPTCECLGVWHPLWSHILIMDGALSMNFDQMPITRPPDGYNHLQALICASRVEFWNCFFTLNCLQIQWQSIAGGNTCASIQVEVIESYLKRAAQLAQIARSDKSSLFCSNSVQTTLEQLVFTVHMDFFEGTLHLQAAVAIACSTDKRTSHFHNMVSKFCSVLSAYLKLRRLSPIAELAWELNRASKSSAILLAAFEVILRVNLSGRLFHALPEVLSDSSKRRKWRDEPVPSSCHAGVTILCCLLGLQSCEQGVVAEAEK